MRCTHHAASGGDAGDGDAGDARAGDGDAVLIVVVNVAGAFGGARAVGLSRSREFVRPRIRAFRCLKNIDYDPAGKLTLHFVGRQMLCVRSAGLRAVKTTSLEVKFLY